MVWEVKELAHIKCWKSGPVRRQKPRSRLSWGSYRSNGLIMIKEQLYGRRKVRVALQAEGGRKDRPGKGSASARGQVGQLMGSKKFTCLARRGLLGGQSCRPPPRTQAGAAWACIGRASIRRTGAPAGPWAGAGAHGVRVERDFGRVGPGQGCKVSGSVAGAGAPE